MVSKFYSFKGARKSILIAVFLFLSCTSTNKSTGVLQTTAISTNKVDISEQIHSTHDIKFSTISMAGSNYPSCKHPKLNKFLFSSSSRIPHSNLQIYEYEIDTDKESRISFQNGNAFDACYHPKENYIVYSSTTDYEKENLSDLFEFDQSTPNLTNPSSWILSNADIYISSIKGDKITRASFINQSELFPQYHPINTEIVYTSQKKLFAKIYRMNRFRKPLGTIGGEYANIYSLKISPNGQKLAWYAKDKDGVYKIFIAQWPNKNLRSLNVANLYSPGQLDWINNENLILSTKLEKDEHHKLYIASLEESEPCFAIFAESKSDIFSPLVLSDSKIVFNLTGDSNSEMLTAEFSLASICPKPKASSEAQNN